MAKKFVSSVAIIPIPEVREIILSMTFLSLPRDREALSSALSARGISPLRSQDPGQKSHWLVIGYGKDVRRSDALAVLRQIVKEAGLLVARVDDDD